MYQGNIRKILILLLVLCTAVTFYFLFVGFDRSSISDQSMRYSLIPEGIPLHLPVGREFRIWFFELGNFIVFIPFGIIIPLLFRCSFIRFISCFILCITILETIQMISRLGAFDIDDIIINTLGAAVGYGSQRIVTRHRDAWKGMFQIALIAVVMSIATIGVVGGINYYLNQAGGEIVALNKLPVKDGTVLWDEELTRFSAGQTEVEPLINLYSTKNAKLNTFSYHLNGNYTKLRGDVVVPNDVIYGASSSRNEIIFIADGTEIYSLSLGGEHQPDSFQIPIQGVSELTISFYSTNSDSSTNIVMWDVTLTEVNTGQKIMNLVKSLF
ncbi:VanZ family protein [Paenibacillus sp. FSL K6-0108]|uniref:VanZ family protein n=1 Tax=Paenibacillus sp. FSL K6-0108 TaxID=2921417 RepID=UPI0032511ECC